MALLNCHASQVYEWLPYTQNTTAPATDRLAWLKQWYGLRPAHVAKRYASDRVEYAEAYEVSEYGGKFDPALFDLKQTSPKNK